MKKSKKEVIKAAQYVAIDVSDDAITGWAGTVIAIGTRVEVETHIEAYVAELEMTPEDVEECIKIYEISRECTTQATPGLVEVTFY